MRREESESDRQMKDRETRMDEDLNGDERKEREKVT